MLPDLLKKLDQYIEIFTREDEELYVQEISNREAYAYLSSEIPLIDCPDQEIERTYYFRWWTFRKHWKETPYGHILSEFLPVVQWAGPYNSIICAAPHHIREGRWLNDRKQWVKNISISG